MSETTAPDELSALDRLLVERVVSVDQAAGEIGVSRTTIAKWRKNRPGLTYSHMLKLRQFLARHASNAGSWAEPYRAHNPSHTREGNPVQMSVDHMEILTAVIRLPPSLQSVARAQIEALSAVAQQLENRPKETELEPK